MKKFRIYPYKLGSKSAKLLSQELSGLQIRKDSTTYHPRPNHIIINWGNSNMPSWGLLRTGTPIWFWRKRAINNPQAIKIAYNKLETFKHFDTFGNNVPCPDWSCNKHDAQQWINEGHKVFCRQLLTSNSGQGIVLASTLEELVNAPLYTKYTKAKHEFRVHVMNGQIIDFVQKKKRNGVEANPYIKSHNYGWIFARDRVILPEIVKTIALTAVSALSLDFGAVDIGYKTNENKAFVYEVNTAPGLTNTTLQRYVQAFKENYLD